jgi:hypothetical protein
MLKKVLLFVALLAAGGMGFASAQETKPVAKAHHKAMEKTAHLRIVKLKDRIQNQRVRIALGLKNNTLTADQAASCGTVLTTIQDQMKKEREANGSKKTMSQDQYAAYNTSLDANSSLIKEEKQYFYYYGPYADNGPTYDYYYDEYPVSGSPTPSVSALEKSTPMIFELKQRIADQRTRIDSGLADNQLTPDQASACRVVLKSVESQMKADYKANNSKKMTRDQYTAYNASLDANSSFIHEEKQYYYYYDPYYDQYSYWD